MTQARRLPNWPELLTAELEKREEVPFGWGSNDCGYFMSACVQAMTGVAVWSQSYSTTKEAVSLIRAGGGIRAMLTKVADAHGWKRREFSNEAQRGDVVLLADERAGEVAGICTGPAVVCPGQFGAVRFPLDHCLVAWEIPLRENGA